MKQYYFPPKCTGYSSRHSRKQRVAINAWTVPFRPSASKKKTRRKRNLRTRIRCTFIQQKKLYFFTFGTKTAIISYTRNFQHGAVWRPRTNNRQRWRKIRYAESRANWLCTQYDKRNFQWRMGYVKHVGRAFVTSTTCSVGDSDSRGRTSNNPARPCGHVNRRPVECGGLWTRPRVSFRYAGGERLETEVTNRKM